MIGPWVSRFSRLSGGAKSRDYEMAFISTPLEKESILQGVGAVAYMTRKLQHEALQIKREWYVVLVHNGCYVM